MKPSYQKRRFTLKDGYLSLYNTIRTAPYLRGSEESGKLPHDFQERLMLAVTEVNGCAVCSYYHSKLALEAGMSSGEIQQMLAGDLAAASESEAVALMFAQHYAETKARPSRETWERLVAVYGLPKSQQILASIRMITTGNIFGIAISAFLSRLKGKPEPGSTLFYELGFPLSALIFMPVALLHGLYARLNQEPLLSFD